MALTGGSRLGPYEILSTLGSGGMGEVYRARDTRLKRDVAIKVLPAGDVSPDRSRRFIQEAQAASALNHPNIVTIYDVGSDSNVAFIAMELVEGQTLAERLSMGPAGLPTNQALSIARQISDALDAAHAAGIVHRDLKPGNVMIATDGRVKLLDFGLAKRQEGNDLDVTNTIEGTVLGTFAYMSPEQVRGKPADVRSDVFAFGAVLYEMLSGRRAFPGETATVTAAAVLRDEPAPLTGVPPEVAAVAAKCLRKHPGERYARVSEVKAILDSLYNTPESRTSDPEPSIAVLPFANLSADKENEYFSDGLAEEILNALTRVPGLKVTARTSAFAFRGEKQDIRKIGETLGVRTVLEGSVRRAGNRIRVTAQLINASDGYHLWSERYDRDMTDVFAVQDEMSQAIVDALKVRLSGARMVAARRTANIEAYHAYLKGRFHTFKLSPEDLARSHAYFEDAIRLDPDYAPGHAGLALSLSVAVFLGVRGALDTMPLVKVAALKAIALDESQADAHAVLARVAGEFDYDWNEALRRCRLALACDDVSPETSALCVNFVLFPLGRIDEALAALQRALTADPLSAFPRVELAGVLLQQGSYDRAIGEMRQALGHHGDLFWYAHVTLGHAYAAMGLMQEAIDAFEKGLQISAQEPTAIGALAGLYVRTGDRFSAERVLAGLDTHPPPVRALGQACFHVSCFEFDRAAGYFDTLVDARQVGLAHVLSSPMCASFRKSPPGRAVLARMNLPDVSSHIGRRGSA
jgi:TolB-like protein/Tfp pilus assembly protein PilF